MLLLLSDILELLNKWQWLIGMLMQGIIVVFLIWYTIETFRLRKENQKQTDALCRPLLDYDGKPPWNLDNFPLKLLNLGKGIAKHIEGYLISDNKSYKLYFSPVGEDRAIEVFEGLGTVEFFREGIRLKIKKDEFKKISKNKEDKLFLKYQNINDRYYATEIFKDKPTRFIEINGTRNGVRNPFQQNLGQS